MFQKTNSISQIEVHTHGERTKWWMKWRNKTLKLKIKQNSELCAPCNEFSCSPQSQCTRTVSLSIPILVFHLDSFIAFRVILWCGIDNNAYMVVIMIEDGDEFYSLKEMERDDRIWKWKRTTMEKYDKGKIWQRNRWRWKKMTTTKNDDGKIAEKILPWSDPLGACRHYKLGNLNRDPKFDHDSDSF